MSEIAVLGGTFDPFHIGHLAIAEAVLSRDDIDRLMIVPAKVSPFKLGKNVTGEKDRIAMVQLVAEDLERAEVSTVETDRDEVSYTYETLGRLRALYPEDKLWFVVGSDSLIDLETWHRGEDLLREFSFILATRPGYDLEETDSQMVRYMEEYGTSFKILQNEHVNISSTEIRRKRADGGSLEGLVPEKVAEYIYEHGLYT